MRSLVYQHEYARPQLNQHSQLRQPIKACAGWVVGFVAGLFCLIAFVRGAGDVAFLSKSHLSLGVKRGMGKGKEGG